MATRGNKPKVELLIDLDSSPALKQLKDFGSRVNATSTGINQSLEILKKAWNAIAGAIRFAAEQVSKWIELASEQERQDNRLAASLKIRGQFTTENFKALQLFNSEIQRSIGIGDESLQQLQSTLLAMGVQRDQLESATKATVGLTEVTGGGLADASRVVAKVMQGQVSALREYGIIAEDVNDATERMTELFSLAEANSRTLSTRMKVLDAALGDMGEAAGRGFTKNQDLINGVDGVTTAVETATPVVETYVDWHLKMVIAVQKLIAEGTGIPALGRAIKEHLPDSDNLTNAALAAKLIADATAPPEDEPRKKLSQKDLDRASGISGKVPKFNVKGSRTNPVKGDRLDPLDPFTFVGPSAEQFLADQERRQEMMRDAEMDLLDLKLRLRKEANDRVQANEDNALAVMEDRTRAHVANQRNLYGGMLQGITDASTAMLQGVASGQQDAAQTIFNTFQSLSSTIGTYLLQMAFATTSSGEAAATIGTPAGLVSGPQLAAAAAQFIGAGISMAGALALRGRQGRAAARAGRLPSFSRGGGGGGRGSFGDIPRASGFVPSQQGGSPVTVIVNFSGPIGSEVEAARKIQRVIDRGRQMHPGGRWG